MHLRFLGTRGNTRIASPDHRRHSSLLVEYRKRTVMIDCGADWREAVWSIRPAAIVLTHAHSDHAWGLRDGAPCPVYATADTWQVIARFPIAQRRTIIPRQSGAIVGITLAAFPVMHSLRAPAVGYRISVGAVTIFYVPDAAAIPDQAAALRGAQMYVGDGATLTRSLLRRRGDVLIGHAPIAAQLTWCQQEGVPRAIFTHCGSEIIRGGAGKIGQRLRALAEERGLVADIAHDGLTLTLP